MVEVDWERARPTTHVKREGFHLLHLSARRDNKGKQGGGLKVVGGRGFGRCEQALSAWASIVASMGTVSGVGGCNARRGSLAHSSTGGLSDTGEGEVLCRCRCRGG